MSRLTLGPEPPAPACLSTNGDRFEWLSNRLIRRSRQLGPPVVTNSLNRTPAVVPEGLARSGRRPVPAATRRSASPECSTCSVPWARPTSSSTRSARPRRPWEGRSPLQAVDLVVNGRVVLPKRLGPRLRPTVAAIPSTRLTAVRAGPTRSRCGCAGTSRPRPAGATATARTRLAVQFRLSGNDSDLAPVEPAPVDVFRLASTENSQLVGPTVRNQGPSAVLRGGDLTIRSLLCRGRRGAEHVAAGRRLHARRSRRPSFRIRGELTDARAGELGSVTVGYQASFASVAFTEASTNISWGTGAVA